MWKWDVRVTLSSCGLLDLINRDGHLQRPDFDDANYTKWDRLSTRVGQWLSGQVDEELKQRLIDEPSEPIHADEVYAAII